MASSKCIALILLAVFMLATVSVAQYGCGSSYGGYGGYGSGYGSYYSPYSSYGSYGYYGKRDAGFGAQQQVEQPHFQHQAAKH